ncbi:MAG: tol-pal system-associated acyl-CoA thioesterase [Gammaproteobacteria bacterium]|nr:tol-pal system-associated acyl-CoA thioesterase [Gammaproteobacteria bacterium]
MHEFRWPVRVYYEDTDSGGVVYYANYLKFMERARTEWLRSLGFEQDRLVRDAGIVFAVTEAELRFLRPGRFNDALTVTARIVERRRASLRFAQAVYRENELLCEGSVRIASLDAARFSPRPIPEALLREIPDVD